MWGAQSTFVLLAALAACAFLRNAPGARQIVCRTALIAVAVLFLGSPLLRERAHPIVPVDLVPLRVESVVSQTATTSQIKTKRSKNLSEALQPRPSRPINPLAIVQEIWLLGIVILGAGLVVGYLRLVRLRKSCELVHSGAVFEAVKTASKSFRVSAPDVRVGLRVVTPFVAGFRRPALFLHPSWLEIQDRDLLNAVCNHEVAHLAAKDLYWNLAQRVSAILLWPQPLIWMLKRPASTASEELCDLQVLDLGIPSGKYAQSLLDLRDALATTRSGMHLGIGAVSIRSGFGRRIESIMTYSHGITKHLSRPARAGWVITSAFAVLLAANLFASSRSGNLALIASFQNRESLPTSTMRVKIFTPDGKPAEGLGRHRF